MVRFTGRWQIEYGHFGEFMSSFDALGAVSRDRGWVGFTLWAPFTGVANEIVVSADYPDLAAAVAELEAAEADPGYMKAFRACGSHFVQGTGSTEMLVPPPQVA